MLRKIRIALAALFFVGITLLLVGIGQQWWGWMAKLQFLPSCLAGNFIVIGGIVLLTLLFGRIYCSVICPLGVFQDVVIWIRRQVGLIANKINVKRFQKAAQARKEGKEVGPVSTIKPEVKHFKFNKERRIVRYGMFTLTAIAIFTGIQLFVALIEPYSAYGRMVRSIVGLSEGQSIVPALLITAAATLVIIGVCAWIWGRAWCSNICPVGTLLGLLSRCSLFKIRICRHSLTPENISSGKIRPCLNWHLGKCAAPCAGLQKEEEYNAAIEDVHRLLSGRVKMLIASCREKMNLAAAQLRFEDAALWKDRLSLLEAHHRRQIVTGHGILDTETYKLLKDKPLPRRVTNSMKALSDLQKDLGMKEKPVHIECFDNSNIQGTNPVAACVVFKDGIPSKKDYRHFLIKTVVGANDYASMKEVVNRRYSRMMAEGEDLPQLVVIDGGKGQLSFALEALSELGIADRMYVVGLAERMEEIIIPGDPLPLFLDRNSSSLRVLMHIRDEAHRFGITHHRLRRRTSMTISELRSVPGVGEVTEQKLISHFKSLKRVREASLEELSAVVGPSLAEKIQDFFKKERFVSFQKP